MSGVLCIDQKETSDPLNFSISATLEDMSVPRAIPQGIPGILSKIVIEDEPRNLAHLNQWSYQPQQAVGWFGNTYI